MGKKLLIDATHTEETRVVVVDGNKVEEFDFETVHRRQLAGNIYLAKVTRVEPSLQAAFVDYGGNRHGFLAFAEIHPDYYQIPMADRQALLEEERALAQAQQDEENGNGRSTRSSRGGRGKEAGQQGGQRDGSHGGRPSDKAEADARANDAVEDRAQAEEPAAEMRGSDTAPDATESDRTPHPETRPTGAPADAGQAEAGDMVPQDTDVAPTAEPQAPTSDADSTGAEPGAVVRTQTQDGQMSAHDDDDSSSPPRAPIAAPIEGKDPVATREIGGMEVVDLDTGGANEVIDAGTGDSDQGADAKADTTDMPATGRRKRAPARDRGGKRGTAGDEGATPLPASGTTSAPMADEEPEPYRAADHAAENDDQIESVADEDVSDELRPPRRPRSRRYKIQEVIKVRQIMLVQVVKEERGNKGAALTTYLSLAGRYCVLMPNTARGGGISRKITVAADRKKLKEIAGELEVPQGAGLIIRTAGANRTKAEIKRDYEYLSRLWSQIRDLTLQSIAPAPIYAEGDLIKRSIRDLYSRDIDEVLVEGEAGYRAAKDFMKMIMPSHARNVKLYNEPLPLFARFQVESYLAAMFNPTVQLKSGGYIVIGVTEALVAIDVNSGKATRQGSIEETALQTNLEAAEEIARQLRLRDLAGLIVIDFIDMEERKNNAAVEKKLKDKLKNDRARIQVGRISGFGLLEMSRQRLRPGMLEATTQPCPHCHGTGLIRSDNSLGLTILRALEEEGTRKRSREVLVRAPVGIVNYLINTKREHLAQIEFRYGMAIRVEADPAMVSPDYTLEKFKTATRIVSIPISPVVSFDTGTMSALDAEGNDTTDEAEEAQDAVEISADATTAEPSAPGDTGSGGATGEGDSEQGKPKRRRRRRRRGSQRQDDRSAESDSTGQRAFADNAGKEATADSTPALTSATAPSPAPEIAAATVESPAPADTGADPETVTETATPAKPSARRRSPRKTAHSPAKTEAKESVADGGEPVAAADAGDKATATSVEPAKKPAPRRRAPRKTAAAKAATVESAQADAAPQADNTAAPTKEAPASPTDVMTPERLAPQAHEALKDAEKTPARPESQTTAEGNAEPDTVTEEAAASSKAQESVTAADGAGTSDPGTAPKAETATEASKAPAVPRRRGWWSQKS